MKNETHSNIENTIISDLRNQIVQDIFKKVSTLHQKLIYTEDTKKQLLSDRARLVNEMKILISKNLEQCRALKNSLKEKHNEILTLKKLHKIALISEKKELTQQIRQQAFQQLNAQISKLKDEIKNKNILINRKKQLILKNQEVIHKFKNIIKNKNKEISFLNKMLVETKKLNNSKLKDVISVNKQSNLKQKLQNKNQQEIIKKITQELIFKRKNIEALRKEIVLTHSKISNKEDEQVTNNSNLTLNFKSIFIASGGSSGSHLLAVQMANFKPFITGPELNIASHPGLFNKESFRINLHKGLYAKNHIGSPIRLKNGNLFHVLPSLFLTNKKDLILDSSEAKFKLQENVYYWPNFVNKLYEHLKILKILNDDLTFIEHSPTNAICFPDLLQVSNAYGVHIIRDPRDAVASMLARRKYQALFTDISDEEMISLTLKQWATLNASAFKAKNNHNYLLVKYEDLVLKPQKIIASIFDFLDIGPLISYPHGSNIFGEIKKQNGWNFSPLDGINSSSVGRYKNELNSKQLNQIIKTEVINYELDTKMLIKEFMEEYHYT
ncbi:sulfotransferase domain protein [Legionella oakridgensis ATCC 33761 = DSM 21215]|uniref:Sulfotransferase domain protein n=1 Tax=Legionella oakridgensis ATCC 33761 = DSM 21215 TaxID=1268635 RepID=W0BB30_9GAMM|nr:sulfotransferase [Legionella oakridgensis]AHE65634.1 sulfotransferase domain protein [Legionella oakridgensis ATCC 33761 = DSM 21215]